MLRVPVFKEPPNVTGNVQAVEFSGDRLILGTDSGAIATFVWENKSWTPSVTRQTKRNLAVSKLIASIVLNRLLVLTDGRTVAGYFLDTLENLPKFSMRDVTEIVSEMFTKTEESQKVAIFTSTSIKFLDITQENAKVARSIDYPGISTGCWVGSKLLLATKDTYELLDLTKDSKIPLFPVAPGLSPIMGVVGQNEFLVVQGTGEDDVAMGLIVTDEGEVARQGDVIMWDSYPKMAVVVCKTHLLSVVKSQLLIHALETKIELLEHDFGDRPVCKVLVVSGPMLEDSKMVEKIGRNCTNRAQALIIYEDASMDWWVPPSRFLQLETRILEGEIEEISPDLVDIGTEQGVLELEYLSLLLALHLLAEKQFSKAVGAWLDGVKLDPQIVLYLFGDTDSVSLPPGLQPMAQELSTKLAQDSSAQKFYRTYLRAQLKRIPTMEQSVALRIEETYASKLQGQALLDFVAKQATVSFTSLMDAFRDKGAFDTLEKIYSQREMKSELLKLWRGALKGDNSMNRSEAVSKIAAMLEQSTNKDLVWEESLNLVSYDPEAGVSIFKKTKLKFDEQQVLDALKQQESDLAWRSYLKYLVYDLKQPSFTADLTTIIATDLVEGVKDRKVSKFVKKLYKDYMALAHPKRAFYQHLEKYHSQMSEDTPIYRFLQLELDFWGLICRPEADLATLTALLDEHAPQLIIERAAIYSYLGLHTQCIELLDSINDYESLLYYCEHGRPAPPSQIALEKQRPRLQLDITHEIFRQLSRKKENAELVGDFLRKKYAEISLDMALEHLSAEWPASEFTQFFAYHLSRLADREKQSMLLRGVSKRENTMVSSEFEYKFSK